MTQDEALDILKTGANVFLTGEPGSGKSYTVNQYVAYLREHDIEPAITASTGIAATHIGGLTIHSWSGIGIKNKLTKYDVDKIASTEYLAKRIRWTKILIIDEVSMLSADTLTMVDQVCKAIKQNDEPFGGIQVVLVGDFFQLPPVVKSMPTNPRAERVVELGMFDELESGPVEKFKTPFAYNAPVWPEAKVITCYLTEQHRQDDQDFLGILSAIRTDTFGDHHLKHLTSRRVSDQSNLDKVTKLFSHNIDVDWVNDQALAKIDTTERVFDMQSYGGPEGLITALKKGCLSPEVLTLKIGATVMFTKNSPKDGYVNGTMGTVLSFDALSGNPIVKTKTGEKITVETAEWVVEENGKVRAGISQLPLRLAWAITVHKSQGMSLDEAVMDLSQVFEYGQGYVALSRVRRLSGLHLLGLNNRVFKVHPEVLEKDAEFRAASSEAALGFAKLGESELTKIRHNFILASGGVVESVAGTGRRQKTRANVKSKVDTYNETLVLLQTGKTLAEIALERGLTAGTIIAHLEKLKAEQKVAATDLERLITPALKKSLPKIHTTFLELKTTSLAPVFNRLGGRFSYDELKLARLVLP